MEKTRGNGHKEGCTCSFCKPNKTKIDWRIIIVAIAGITIIEVVALLKGMNGKFLAGAMAAIGALAGLVLPQLKLK